jgi:acetoin utilization deacetylase AcuC-like enzyme
MDVCFISLTDNVLSGKFRNGFAIIRPPGHHAMKEECCGFSYFNNVAMAAKQALNKGNIGVTVSYILSKLIVSFRH